MPPSTNPHRHPAAGADEQDPMGTHIVHYLLVGTQQLQRIPAGLVALILLLLAAGIGWLWADAGAFASTFAVAFLTMLTHWLLLWRLPLTGRSYGPDRPATLALGVLAVLIAVILRIFNAPLAVLVGAFGVLIALVYYSTYIEPFKLGVTTERLTIPAWPTTPRPLRLLHIGDIHIERLTQREHDLNQHITDLAPDIIVFSGDFVSVSYTHDARTQADIRQLIGAWSAPLGVYCVGGTYTVEPADRVRAFTDGLDNLRLLMNEWVTIPTPGGDLHLLGMQTTHKTRQDQTTLQRLWAQKPPSDGMTLLLTHAPDVAPEADALRCDLYVCGHTHGGQLRLPLLGAVFTGSAYGRKYVMGRYNLTHTTLYTTRGVGLEGWGAPRARFLCPPEVVLWEINGGRR